jgi:Fe-S-cluster-containing dehydrogenase component
MELNRRELLQRAWRTGLALFGGAALFEVVRGDLVAAAADARTAAVPHRAMTVDVALCLKHGDCRDCIIACHKGHNVPSIADKKREIKWIWKETFERAFPDEANEYTRSDLKGREVMALCNHCDNPPCVRVCPTAATWKREDGIVMMDMHRCIGCRYCMAACPYGSRSFNWYDPAIVLPVSSANPDYPRRTKGVVEKCSFCAEQVDANKPPLCVASCKEGALLFGDLNDAGSGVRKALAGRFALRRKPWLGTGPNVFYLV